MSFASAPSTTAERIIGLDMVRAVAILLVLVCHWAGHFGYWFDFRVPPVAELVGDLGVGLFFALSGFLIGRILIGLGRTRPGWAAYGTFMKRRFLRTMPLYFLWLGLLLVLFPPRQDAMATALRFATLTQNLLRPMPADYYFAVTWSLTIEEWFYLLFGGAFIAAARWLGPRGAARLCLPVFMILPLAARFAMGGEPPPLVPFRLDMICYGVLVALAWDADSRLLRFPRACLAAGAALIALVIADLLPTALEPNLLVAGCALCLPAALSARIDRAWLAGPARWIAARSYGLYLTHLTIVYDVIEVRLWEAHLLPAWVCVALALVLPFVVADLTYRLIERPLLRPHGPRLVPGGVPALGVS